MGGIHRGRGNFWDGLTRLLDISRIDNKTMARSCFILRCHGFGLAEKRVLDSASSYFDPSDILMVMDERKGPVAVGADYQKLALTNNVIRELKLLAHPNCGWLCGDYPYYIASRTRPDYDFYWLCEPDVYFSYRNPAEFFSNFESNSADFVAPWLTERGETWPWTKRAKILSQKVFGCIFPLTRLSNRAIGHLLAERRKLVEILGKLSDINNLWPNDESFVSTILMRDGFHCEDLGKSVELSKDRFLFTRPILLDTLTKGPWLNTVLHPVLSKDQYVQKYRSRKISRPKKKQTEAWLAGIIDDCPRELHEDLRIALLEMFMGMLWRTRERSECQKQIKNLLQALRKSLVDSHDRP